MNKSNLLEAPTQASASSPAPAGNGNPLLAIRKRRAVALVPTVRPVFGGFRVSSSCRDISYLVTQPNGHLVCTCPDFLRHEDEPEFRCKHSLAVEMALEEDRVSAAGDGRPSAAPAEPAPSNGLSVLHRYLLRISVKVATCFGLKVATHRSVATRAFKLTKSGNFASSFSDISGLFSAF